MEVKQTVCVTLELDADLAAALTRFADKVSHVHARAVLYPHVAADIRGEQAREIICAFGRLHEALTDAGARAWPWIETGDASHGR